MTKIKLRVIFCNLIYIQGDYLLFLIVSAEIILLFCLVYITVTTQTGQFECMVRFHVNPLKPKLI
jgi:hypothetical protein